MLKNSCIKLEDRVGIVRNIVRDQIQQIKVVFESFEIVEDYFTSPLPSGTIGIHKVRKLDGILHTCSLMEIKCKCAIFPHKSGHPLVALNHQVW